MNLDYKALAAGLVSAIVVSFATHAHAQPADKKGVKDDEQRPKALLVASRVSGVVSVKDGTTVR